MVVAVNPGLSVDTRNAVSSATFALAVEHPVVAVAAGTSAQRACVGPAIRFGQPEAAEGCAGGQLRQPVLLLFVAAVSGDGFGYETE